MNVAVWILVPLLVFVGLVGSIVPLLPGTTLILVAVSLQAWLLPDTLSWAVVGWIAAFWLLSVLADFGCTLLGTKLLGGGRWGMAGATGGALAGMFFSLPVLLLGTMFGAVAAEKWLGKKTDEQALKAGTGAALGFLASSVAKFVCALAMVALYAFAVFRFAAAA